MTPVLHVRTRRMTTPRRSWARRFDQGVPATACGAPITAHDINVGDLRAVVASPTWAPQLCATCRAKYPEVR